MREQSQTSLKGLNSFAVESMARKLVRLDSDADIEAITFNPKQDLLLGGGSNILLVGNVPGVVYLNTSGGRQILDTDSRHVWIEANAGENWHQFVQWSLSEGYSGLENLSLIPGNVGAAPMQNIGAYGVELSEFVESLRCWDLHEREWRVFSAQQCEFAYRHSRFKSSADAGRYVIASVRFRLNRRFVPRLEYQGLTEALPAGFSDETSATEVANAVISIRQSKLPDPVLLGNAGSFFKNPVVNNESARLLTEQFPELPLYPLSKEKAKLSAAWMIEHCGWKGHRCGDAGVSGRHSLVLVNFGAATGKELLHLANRIRASVEETFDLALEIEPRVVDFSA